MSAAATSPALISIFWGIRSSAKMAVSATMRIAAAIANRVRSRRVKVAGGAAGRGFSAGGQSGWSVRVGRVGRAGVGGEVCLGKRAGNELGDAAAVGTAFRLRSEPAHHLAHVAGVGRSGGGDRVGDERLERRVVELFREV